MWTGRPGAGPAGPILRYDPATDTHETYTPAGARASGPRGVDVDTKGIIWTGLGGSGHLAKFDRSKCTQTWGTGDQCPEGWTLYRAPGPMIQTGDGPENETSADFHYYLWVDQFNTLGLGKDVVILNGTGSDSLLAFDQKTEKFTVIRVPYPLNLFTRGLDGRIDDPRPAGRAAGCGSTTASTRCCTPRSSSRTWATCSSGRIRWPGRADVTPPLRRGAGAEGWRTRGSSMPPRTG